MPYFANVADAVWGKGCNFDSDGDFNPADPASWREFQARLRPELKEEIDIFLPTQDQDLILIEASAKHLLENVIQYLIDQRAIERIEDTV